MKKDIRAARVCKWCGKKMSGRHHWLCDKCWKKWKRDKDRKESKKYGWSQ